MEPKVVTLKKTRLIGMKMSMSLANNRTAELWQRFMPERAAIGSSTGSELFSVEVYHDPAFFKNFDPEREFEKWAAIEVNDFDTIPDGMGTLVIPEGQYAVFHYKGKPSEAQGTYRYIHNNWIPDSVYELDDRPHFALMGAGYKSESPESEEEFWIPIK